MANTFALILTLATLITGVMWCMEKFVFARRRAVLSPPLEQTEQQSKKKNKEGWFESLASLFPVLLVVFILRSFIYEPFQIPSGSMMPTLLVGDFILVEKFAYGIKDPIMQKTLIDTNKPKRGDIVVFKYPPQPSLDYIKRVIGLPGDRIIYDPFNKELIVQPHCDHGSQCSLVPIHYSDIQPSGYVQGYAEKNSGTFKLPVNETMPDSVRIHQRMEKIGDIEHRILLVPGHMTDVYSHYYQQPGQPPFIWVVPPGHYFMMGDNRDNSADSRYWGFVPETNLVGRASIIWLSFKKRENEWPTGIRFERIGGIH